MTSPDGPLPDPTTDDTNDGTTPETTNQAVADATSDTMQETADETSDETSADTAVVPPPSRAEKPPSHYFDTTPAVASKEAEFRVTVPGASFRMRTDTGVFSHGHLDVGTNILLRSSRPLPATGTALDLGCGAGPIAITMAMRSPGLHVWAVDINERALALTAANVAANDVPNVTVASPDDVPADLRFDAIWANPPIRIGKPALHELLTTWLARLTPTGRAALVVQKNLGSDSLQRWLTEEGFAAKRVTAAKGYRVLAVEPRA